MYYFPEHFADGKLLEILQDIEIDPSGEVEDATQSNQSQLKKARVDAYFLAEPKLEISWVNQAIARKQDSKAKWRKRQQAERTKRANAHNQIQSAWSELINRAKIEHDATFKGCPKSPNKYSTFLYSLASKYATVPDEYPTTNYSQIPAFDRDGNLEEIPDNKLESIPSELVNEIHDAAEWTNVRIEGPPLLQEQLRKIIYEFRDIFKATVQRTPAKLDDFVLEVDKEQWETHANRGGARQMDRERSAELRRIMSTLEGHDIVEHSDASHYSHAFLVPKPNGKWRLVLDFKNLNKATKNHYTWPLPNIKEILDRIGASRPQFFGVFDLTSGYYQAPISEESRKYTAFKTSNGIYQWKRLPMGLTGAGSFFQRSLSTRVLKGLIGNGVELYLDDCLVYAPTQAEYLERLREVFTRFRDSGITLNPSKSKVGLSQVEYVGHTIDEYGLHFTQSQLDKVLNFPRPETKRKLKAFLGLANYFRDHIKNHSIRVGPLQRLVANYEKRHSNHRPMWTQEATAAFEDIRNAIDKCPKLWFMDDTSPIFLQTDASDYGIGAYLYQMVPQPDGSEKECPVGFISKSIASQHLNWDTPTKEGFAIFYALRQWEYLLRDRKFTILTDHENLTRLRADHLETNKMVKRWFMCYQEFDIIAWKHRKGEDNEVPDTLSRLCPENAPSPQHLATHLFHLTGDFVPEDKWDLIAQHHNSLEVGHGGIQRTVKRLQIAGHTWRGMHRHVKRFIKLCPCCQKMSQLRKVIHSHPFSVSAYGLWNTVSVDFIEKLTPDKDGNTMIVVIVDNFSRFVDLHAKKSNSAESAAEALIEFTGRFNVTPANLCTDQGSNFKSQLIEALVERLGAGHHLTTAYSKQQNAIVERQNKEVLRHLRNIIADHKVARNWSRYLPIVQRIMNSSINTSTGVAPADIVFPNRWQIDSKFLDDTGAVTVSDYIQDMQDVQGRLIELCSTRLRERDAERINAYNPDRTTEFEPGTYVLAEHRHNSLRRGPKSKLLPFLRGPLLVKSHNEKGIYLLQDIITQKLSEYHVSLLRKFDYTPENVDPTKVAISDDTSEFFVEKCLDIRGDPRRRKSSIECLIRWAGYGPEKDSWEPWEHVRDTEQVLDYIHEHPNRAFKRLLPKGYVPSSSRHEEPELSDGEMSVE